MVQRIIVSLLLLLTFASGAYAADAKDTKDTAKKAAPAPAQVEKKPNKTSEQLYLDGVACLSTGDTICAQVAWAMMIPASPYSKLLEGQIAAFKGDWDTTLRLLIPLQAESKLLPQAYASLHVTLGQAYVRLENPLRALDQFSRASAYTDPLVLEEAIWKLVSAQPKEVLLEMRGAVDDSTAQGWIDLALAASYADRRAKNVEQWRLAYPSHVISEALLAKIAGGNEAVAPAPAPQASTLNVGKIALLLPLHSKLYANAAQAVQAGFMAAYAYNLECSGSSSAILPTLRVLACGAGATASLPPEIFASNASLMTWLG